MRDARPVRRHHPRGVRRTRPRPADLHRRHRGAGLRLDEPDRHRQHAHHGGHADHGARDRGAEAALAPRHGHGRAPRRASRCPSPTPGATPATSPAAAQRDGDEYVLNGTKAWVTNGERAAIVALAARTEEGISAFIVEKEPGPRFEGISVSKNVSKLGYRGVETVEMAYADHRIPAANLDRRGRPWPAPDPRRARDRPHQHRGAGRRRGAGRLRRRPRLRAAARDLRQGDRRAPGDPAEAGRHGDAPGGGAAAHQERGRAQGARACAATSRPGWPSSSPARRRSS